MATEIVASPTDAKEKLLTATPRQLMWWRFRKHKLAVAGTVIIALFYLVVVFADCLAYSDPNDTEAFRALLPPQSIQFLNEGRFEPHVYKLVGARDPLTMQKVYVPDPEQKVFLTLFAEGFSYSFLGMRFNTHLLGTVDGRAEESLFLLGTDAQGRDMFSRLMYATRTSLSIGLIGVVLSLTLGITLGGISGFFGGLTDTLIQRLIEIIRSVPTIPLWMGLAASLPKEWSVIQVYLAITVIISLIGWTELARVVRGRFLTLREEQFVVAAELDGASDRRIIFRHMLPSFVSHIIAATSLAFPAMILSETALSFLGLGLRPPAMSWGVLLQQAQNVQTLATAPWLLVPCVPVIIVILSFNFMGDGLRDAADPYGH
jgi:peptide/nickel transport system permease protein